MTEPQPTPTILDHAREAIRRVARYRLPGRTLTQWNLLCDHAFEHYAEIAAALLAAHDQRATELEAAYREGYGDASDPAWCAKELRRAGVDTEPYSMTAMNHFWGASETKASLDQPGNAKEATP